VEEGIVTLQREIAAVAAENGAGLSPRRRSERYDLAGDQPMLRQRRHTLRLGFGIGRLKADLPAGTDICAIMQPQLCLPNQCCTVLQIGIQADLPKFVSA